MKIIKCKDTNESFIFYNDYLKSKHWYFKRKEFFNKNSKICNKCRSKKNLVVHHKTYKHIGNELLSDLICLCEKCHNKFHSNKKLNKINNNKTIIKIKKKKKKPVPKGFRVPEEIIINIRSQRYGLS